MNLKWKKIRSIWLERIKIRYDCLLWNYIWWGNCTPWKNDRKSNTWRKYTASLRSMANPQDDCNRNLEVDIHPRALQVVHQGPQSSVKDLETWKAFYSKLQDQNEAFCKYKETQKWKMQILNCKLQRIVNKSSRVNWGIKKCS